MPPPTFRKSTYPTATISRCPQPYDGRILTLLLGDRNFAVRYGNFLSHYAQIQQRLPGAAVLDLRLEDRITVVE